MSRLDEYIKRYEGLHTAKDSFRAAQTGKIIPHDQKELFTGIQFLRKFPKHLKRITEEKGRAVTLLDYGCGKGNMPWRPYESYKNGLWVSYQKRFKAFISTIHASRHFLPDHQKAGSLT